MPEELEGESYERSPHRSATSRLERIAEAALRGARGCADWRPGDRIIVLMTGPNVRAGRRAGPGRREDVTPMAHVAGGYVPAADGTPGRGPLADMLAHSIETGRATGLTGRDLALLMERYR